MNRKCLSVHIRTTTQPGNCRTLPPAAYLASLLVAAPLVWFVVGPWLVEKINHLAGMLP